MRVKKLALIVKGQQCWWYHWEPQGHGVRPSEYVRLWNLPRLVSLRMADVLELQPNILYDLGRLHCLRVCAWHII